MQRVSPRASLIGLALTGGLIAAMLMVFMLTIGGQATPKAFAIVTPPAATPTPTCVGAPPTSVPNKCLPKGTPTPKAAGAITGVYDIAVYVTAPPVGPVKPKYIYAAMTRLDEYAGDVVKTGAVAYVNIGGSGIGDPNAEPPGGVALPPMGPGGAPGGSPPPPYTTLAPSKGYGNVIGDVLHTWTCFPDIGGTLGPNLVAEVIIPDFQGQIDGTAPNGIKRNAMAGGGAPGALGAPGTGLYLTGGLSQLECEDIESGIFTTKLAAHTNPGLFIQFSKADSTDPQCAGAAPQAAGVPGCALASWRHAGAGAPFGPPIGGYPDWDGDKCTDSDELYADKLGTKCSDDPWNPNDTNPPHSDVAGIYSLVVVGAREDICQNNTWKHQGQPGEYDCSAQPDHTKIPGLYYTCDVSITQVGQALTAKILCYIDGILLRTGTSPILFTVNPDAAPGNATTCPPAAARYCGNGSPGAAPPGCTDNPAGNCANALPPNCTSLPCPASKWMFAQISNPTKKHTVLTGTYDKTANMIELSGCFNNSNANRPPIVPVFARAKIDAHTGHGWVSLFVQQTDAACKAGTPSGTPIGPLAVSIARQACVTPGADNWCAGAPYTAANWDTDGDGCPDRKELGDVQTAGGMRDPSNRWDFFNPEKTNTPTTQTVADILKVVGQFGKNQGNVNYTTSTDRTGILGSNSWNLGPADGQQTVADILAAVKQFGHGCNNS